MKIKTLRLTNFRNLEDFTIDFEDNLTVLVADNSAGKTSILDGVTIALSPYIGEFPTTSAKGFKDDDVTRLEVRNSVEKLYPVKLSAAFSLDSESQELINIAQVDRALNSAKSKTTIKYARQLSTHGKNLCQLVKNDSDVILPIISYYGTARLWVQKKYTQKSDRNSNSRFFAYHDCLLPESNYQEFERWFIDLSLAEYDEIVKYAQDIIASGGAPVVVTVNPLLQAVREAVNIVLEETKWGNLRYDASEKTIAVENSSTKLPVKLMSDGVQSTLALVADIAYRCAKLNPHLDSPCKDTNGIVLIDEIDMHLHPKWQQTVLSSLQKIFPKIQFIVTTHSPQVLSTVRNTNIRIIDPIKNEAETPAINPYGRDSIVALEDVMNVSATAIEVIPEAKLLDSYLEIINRGDIDNLKLPLMRKKLESEYGSGDIKLQIADMKISKFRALQK